MRADNYALSEATKRLRDDAQASLTDGAYEEALRLLQKHRAPLDRIAAALLEKETLVRDEVLELLRATSSRSRARRRRSASRASSRPPTARSGLRLFRIRSARWQSARSIHHVGVAVDDLDGAIDTYARLFGGTLEHRERVEEQGVEAASIRVGESRVELLGALGEDTPVGRFLAKRGPGMHHVAYEVDDIRVALADLAGAGAELIDETPRRGMFGLEVAFVHPDSVHGVLSEVVSRA